MIALLLRDLRLAFRAGGGFGLGLAFFLLVAAPFSNAKTVKCSTLHGILEAFGVCIRAKSTQHMADTHVRAI